MEINNQTKIWLILVSLWIINGSSFLAIKVAIDTIPPLLSAGLRFTVAGLVLFIFYFLMTRKVENSNISAGSKQIESRLGILSLKSHSNHPREKIGLNQWKDSIILGLTLFLGGQGLLTWGAQYLSSG